MRLRKRTIAALLALFVTIAGTYGAYLFITNTERGRARLARFTIDRVNRAFGGRGGIRIGRLLDIGARTVVAENVALVDTAGVPVVSVDHLEAVISLRALFSKAILLEELHVRGVHADLRQDFGTPWNIAYIVAGDTTPRQDSGPGFGDDVRVNRLTLTDGVVTTSAPWTPPDFLTGSARDSAIAVRDSLHDIEYTARGILEKRRYDLPRVVAHDVIFTAFDKTPASMQIDTLRSVIADPPVRIVQAQGAIRWTGDSLNLALDTVKLPASVGSATGRIWWHEPGPVRYDILAKARASLSDLQWVWDVLPATGGGTAQVRMQTLADARDVEYLLRDLDVTTDDSHITGRIAVVVTPRELRLRDVALTFDPLQATLLRRLSYGVVPPEIRGALRGELIAAEGGALDNLLIDRLDARFDDATVRGATSSLLARGRVSIGADPGARDLRVLDSRIDLRSVTSALPSLPRQLDGVVVARGLVRSADLRQADVRDLAVTWTDAAGNVSTARGDARVAFGVRNPTVDATLLLDPISMRALARIDSTLPFRGTLAGNVRAVGPVDSLRWEASLRASDSSRIDMRGLAHLGTPEWWARGSGTIGAFDLARWFGRTDMPTTSLTGTVALDVQGGRDSAGVGGVRVVRGDLQLTQTAAPARPGFDLLASAVLDDRQLRIDSASARMGGLLLSANGTLARDSLVRRTGIVDTITFSFEADSIAAAHPDLLRLARMLAPVDSSAAATVRGLVADSVAGTAVGSGYVYGSLDSYGATFSFGGRDLRYGDILIGGLFGSALLRDLPGTPRFETAATATDVDGIGAIQIATAEFRIGNADPARGRILLNVAALDTSQLVVRGEYRRSGDSLTVALDTVRFNYHDVRWANREPILFHDTPEGQRLDSMVLRSNEGGMLAARATLPYQGSVSGGLALDRFPAGELYAFAMATNPFSGLISGTASIEGTRASPLIEWQVRADSLGVAGAFLPQVTSDGYYSDRRLIARAMLADTLGGSLSAEARVPIDLSLASVDKRLLSDSVDADVIATQLQLGALGITYTGVDRIAGLLDGRFQLAGTLERPFARGEMGITGLTAHFIDLGIAPADGRVVVRAARDSLILERFRIRSGGIGDTVSATGAMRIALNEPATMRLRVIANNTIFAKQRDGTFVVASGDVTAAGALARPEISGRLFVPVATIVTDPLGASTALDLTSPAARELLGADEVPVAETATESISRLGRFVTMRNATIELGDEVWVRTPEATVRLTGAVNVVTQGETLALEGEVNASRGVYRLNLGIVSRTFSVDSGSVRFYGNNAIPPTVDISATNVVRSAGSSQIPVRVHIGGTLDEPVLSLSSTDPLYAGAPDSEIISLLIFGAPSFTLDGRSQSTVRAVTNVFAPLGGRVVEGTLQRLLPGFNTVQVQNAGGQTQDDLSAASLLDNLSIVAGKQIGDKTFLRLNTGVCRGSGVTASAGVSLWYGIAIEYLLRPRLTAQVGYDPGGAPCSRIGGDALPRMQFGFDLFKEWIF